MFFVNEESKITEVYVLKVSSQQFIIGCVQSTTVGDRKLPMVKNVYHWYTNGTNVCRQNLR